MVEIAPQRGPEIPHSFDVATAAAAATATAALSTLGAVGLPPPDLQGYSYPAPTYNLGTAIATNKPVGLVVGDVVGFRQIRPKKPLETRRHRSGQSEEPNSVHAC